MFSTFRRLFPLFVAVAVAVLLLFAVRPAKSAAPPRPVPANIRLTRALPSEIARLLVSPNGFVAAGDVPGSAPDGTPLPSAALLPSGIVSLAPDDAARVLRVQGTPAGIAALRGMVRLLDVPRARILLRVRVVREQMISSTDTHANVSGGFPQILATARATTGNGVSVPVTLRALGVGEVVAVVRPRINGDGLVTLAVDLRVGDPANGATLRFLQAERRLRLGQQATFSVLDVPGKGPDAKPARVLLEITPDKTGPSSGRE